MAISLSPAFSSPADQNVPEDTISCPSPALTTTALPPTDKFDVLKSAVDEVRKRIVRGSMHDTVNGEDIVIPKDLAKSWVNGEI